MMEGSEIAEFEGKSVHLFSQEVGELRPLEEFIRECAFLGKSNADAIAKFRSLLETMFQLQQGARLITTFPQGMGEIVFFDVRDNQSSSSVKVKYVLDVN